MDQELDIQIAALIFLAGTQSLGSDHAEEAVETLTDITDDESDEVNPATVNEIISFSTNNSYFLSNCQVNIPTSS
jgi:hypothetical protein|tara:strand:- start:1290 stop:1514 length:225 start_codon:yes stop_codon:yes gene_type:complete